MKNKLIKFAIVFFLFQFSLMNSQGQSPSPYYPKTPASPNAAELGKFGAVPVSDYTGLPNIDIPLYNFQCGNYKYPLARLQRVPNHFYSSPTSIPPRAAIPSTPSSIHHPS